MYNKLFDFCVQVMIALAKMTHTTYKEINVIVFCIIGPLVFLSVVILAAVQYVTIKRLKQKIQAFQY